MGGLSPWLRTTRPGYDNSSRFCRAAPDDRRTIEVFAREVVAPGSTIHTDGALGLRRLADMGYTHHSSRQ
jgi:hypothetical protein